MGILIIPVSTHVERKNQNKNGSHLGVDKGLKMADTNPNA